MRRRPRDPAVSQETHDRGGVTDGFRLAVGTLTIVPTRPPVVVDRRTTSWAMTFAPLVGVLLTIPVLVTMLLLGWRVLGVEPPLHEGLGDGGFFSLRPASPVLTAALAIAVLAFLTRAIHLDGLADTVDGLGSGRPAEGALDIMRRGDIGPFGVVALVLTLLVQVVALAEHVATGRGPLVLALALVLSRLMLPMVCARGIPAARLDGLGHAVAGTVSGLQLLAALAFSAVVLGVAGATYTGFTFLYEPLLQGAVVATMALGAGALVCLWSVRRLSGVTGDVMGACVEVTFTVALVVPSLI